MVPALLSLTLVTGGAVDEPGKEVLAVLPPVVRFTADQAAADQLAQVMVSTAQSLGIFTVVAPKATAPMVEGCYTLPCLNEVGQRLSARLLVLINLSKYARDHRATLRLVDTHEPAVIHTVSVVTAARGDALNATLQTLPAQLLAVLDAHHSLYDLAVRRFDGLEPAELRRRCNMGQLGACSTMAGLILAPGIERADRDAVLLLTKACDGGLARACAGLALALDASRGGQRDTERAQQLLDQSCSMGHTPACTQLGLAWQYGGFGLEPDQATAERYFRQACDTMDVAACLAMARLYRGSGERHQPRRALRILRKACRRAEQLDDRVRKEVGQERSACARWRAWHPSFATRGCQDSATARLARHTSRLKRACGGRLQLDLDFQQGRVRMAGQARKTAEAQCEHDDPIQCAQLGYMQETGLGGGRDMEQAIKTYTRACNRSDFRACIQLMDIYRLGEGWSAKEQRALTIAHRGCGQGFYGTEWYCQEACRLGARADCRATPSTIGPRVTTPPPTGCNASGPAFPWCWTLAIALFPWWLPRSHRQQRNIPQA